MAGTTYAGGSGRAARAIFHPPSANGSSLARRAGFVLRVGACALALLAAGCSRSAPSAGYGEEAFEVDGGDIVAILELAAPTVESFVLRGTLPVPPNTFPLADGSSPFVVTWRNGGHAPAQVEIVSRHPNEAEGADVVEVIARVDRPANAAPGTQIRYAVLWQPHVEPPFAGDDGVEALLAQAGSVTARTRDVFHNTYSADLLEDARALSDSARVLRDGSAAKQVAVHEVLRPTPPVGGAQGTLPHAMGVHAYVTRWAGEPFFSLDLRVHNATSGESNSDPADDPLGKLYFRSLELRLPSGWTLLPAFDDPWFGSPYAEGSQRVWPIVAPMADGKLHMMPAMAQFERRFVVARAGFEARALSLVREENLGFVRAGLSTSGEPFWSWWNPQTAHYFPQRERLPELQTVNSGAVRAADQASLATLAAVVASGTPGPWPVQSAGLGWAHPWGVADGGMQGGDEIWLYDGLKTAWAASNAGYRLHALRHRMYTDRQPNVLFDLDGRHTDPSSWVVQTSIGPTLPIFWYNAPLLWAADPFGFSQAPTFQQQAVAAQGLAPAYEAQLQGYAAIDEAHLVRYTHDAKVMAWLGNDAIARDDLRAQAQGFRFAYTDLPQDVWGYTIPTGLLAAQNYVAGNPGQGLAFGRPEGWGLDTLVAAYSLGDPAFRAAVRPMCDQIVELLQQGQAECTGIIMASPLSNVFNGQYRCRQSIECAITENALVGLRESVYRGYQNGRVEEIDEVLSRSFYSMISPLVWDSENRGPQAMMAVGPVNGSLPLFCSYIPPGGVYGWADHYQIWSSFAYAYRLTGDQVFLEKAKEALDTEDMHALFQSQPLENLANRAALMALVQELNAGAAP